MRSPAASRLTSVKFVLRALSHRNFRLFFVGQGTSLVGSWMTRIATSWILFRLASPSRAAFLLGMVGFCGQLPTFLLTPFAGVLVDRWNRRRLLLITQALSMIESFLLALTVWLPQPKERIITELLLLNVAQGFINAFDMPGRQAFLTEMVTDKEDLPNAIALNSSLFNASRLVGPAAAGALIAAFGEVWCFLIDGVSYLAVLGSLVAMRLAPPARHAISQRMGADLKEGFAYAFGSQPIRWILLLVALTSFMGVSYTVLIPLFADQIRTNSPSVLGFLMGASGLGALVGAFYLASRRTVLGLGRVIVAAAVAMGLGLTLFAWSKTLWISLVLMFVVGLGMIVMNASCNTILQTITAEEKRGRVMSLYVVSVVGMAPFGSLFAGTLAKYQGPNATVAFCGLICIASGLGFAWRLPLIRDRIRPIYRRLGILPPIAQGMQAAATAVEETHL